jgi:ribonuclease HII
MAETSDALFLYDRNLHARYVCGADETGRACLAGPLVTAAVRFDYHRLQADTAAVKRLKHLNDSKQVTAPRRAALLPAIFELADSVSIVVISAAQIDEAGLDVSNKRALARALEDVAVAESVNLVDWFELEGVGVPAQRVEQGDSKSAAIAAASIVAKETRDQLMRGLDIEYPGYGFAAHKGYGGGTGEHEAAIRLLGLSPAHRRSFRCKAYAGLDLSPPNPKPAAKASTSWRDLPKRQKAAHLLATPTISDATWTDEKRLPGESRPDFIARILTVSV